LYFDETFAPVVRLESIRILLAYATHHDFKFYQMDVNSAFLNGGSLCGTNSIRHFMGLNKLQEHGMNALEIFLLKIILGLVRRILHSSLEKWAHIYLCIKYMLMISFLVLL
jgi:hypothetical protein